MASSLRCWAGIDALVELPAPALAGVDSASDVGLVLVDHDELLASDDLPAIKQWPILSAFGRLAHALAAGVGHANARCRSVNVSAHLVCRATT